MCVLLLLLLLLLFGGSWGGSVFFGGSGVKIMVFEEVLKELSGRGRRMTLVTEIGNWFQIVGCW